MPCIKYFIMDVDGTLTDGKVYMGSNGELMKAFDVKDGLGIKELLIPRGVIPIIITGRKSDILKNRCAELGITEIHQGVSNKVDKLKEIAIDNTNYTEFAYIGDDINDLECMKVIKNTGGIIGCPADAVKEVLEIADFVSSKKGGNGAVREFIEWLIN